MGTIHVIGGGLSGISSAVRAASNGRKVVLYEATEHAGGRCRSFFDSTLGCVIDNGNHLLLSSNTNTYAFLDLVNARDRVRELQPARFNFIEPKNNLRWSIKPFGGWIPFWIFFNNRRVLGTKYFDYIEIFKLRNANANDCVADCVDTNNVLFDRLWQPICRAVLNTDAYNASAQLLWGFMRLSFFKGEKACRPVVFNQGLSDALIEPAISYLKKFSTEIKFKSRVQKLECKSEYVCGFHFRDTVVKIEKNDAVILAIPSGPCSILCPELDPPIQNNSIVNVHYRFDHALLEFEKIPIIGLVNTKTHWVFQKKNVLSVTISDANEFLGCKNSDLAKSIWNELCASLSIQDKTLPPWRVIKEKNATIAQTPAEVRKRVPTITSRRNLFVAGDWTQTGFPATIEGSIASGERAAQLACGVT
ncbi:MAG: hypothetical protein CMM44_04925 [Rhodospirillaceae bacterium]|nr:hypothetical protein [Rhodospirillaceae bacterium]